MIKGQKQITQHDQIWRNGTLRKLADEMEVEVGSTTGDKGTPEKGKTAEFARNTFLRF